MISRRFLFKFKHSELANLCQALPAASRLLIDSKFDYHNTLALGLEVKHFTTPDK